MSRGGPGHRYGSCGRGRAGRPQIIVLATRMVTGRPNNHLGRARTGLSAAQVSVPPWATKEKKVDVHVGFRDWVTITPYGVLFSVDREWLYQNMYQQLSCTPDALTAS